MWVSRHAIERLQERFGLGVEHLDRLKEEVTRNKDTSKGRYDRRPIVDVTCIIGRHAFKAVYDPRTDTVVTIKPNNLKQAGLG